MRNFIVREANLAFSNADYIKAIKLYHEAESLIGENLFSSNIRICQNRFYKELNSKQNFSFSKKEFADINRKIKFADCFKVALIADEFTTNSFSDEFIAIPIEPNNWRERFEEHKPDIFLCESAWSGPDTIRRPWKGQIYASKNFTKENRTALLEIISFCRKSGIPTVFWNKEDPTHFTDRVHDFVKTAKEFDFVFTTAMECVEGYKSQYGIDHVFALPFATNTRLFNPIENNIRSSNIVFAGSWYTNHIQRSKDMENILDQISHNGYILEIYDRYYKDSDPLHIWPERYRAFLRPSLPHTEMPHVYKSSRFGLNFNTVTESRTMFARRVFELMSSNTLVVSNYSKGIDEMFGDLVVYPDKQPDRLRSLSDTDIDTLRERALNKVLGEHTYRHRWLQILQNIGIPHAAREYTITATCLINHQAEALEAIAWFQQHGQRQPGSHLLLVASAQMADLDVAELYRKFNRYGVSVTSHSHATRYAMLDRYQPAETSHFLAFNPRNPPPTDWLNRAMLHLNYAAEHPLTPATEPTQRYRTGFTHAEAPLLDLQNRLGCWLQKPQQPQYAYFI